MFSGGSCSPVVCGSLIHKFFRRDPFTLPFWLYHAFVCTKAQSNGFYMQWKEFVMHCSVCALVFFLLWNPVIFFLLKAEMEERKEILNCPLVFPLFTCSTISMPFSKGKSLIPSIHFIWLNEKKLSSSSPSHIFFLSYFHLDLMNIPRTAVPFFKWSVGLWFHFSKFQN